MGDTIRRRGVVLGGLAAVTAGCTSEPAPPSSAPSTSGPSSATPSPTSSPSASATPTDSGPTPWRPGKGELVPAAKTAAVKRVEQINPSAQVFDAQYGGLLSTTASVLVMTSARTFDVRLVLRGARWVVTEVHPSRPGPRAATLTTAARRVLREDRIHLPAAARADIESGQVDDVVLEAMVAMADRTTYGVSVVRSGHPLHVFGTDRLSDHPRGFAVDVWEIDGHPVVHPATPTRLVTGFMEALVGLGADNVGGPVQLNGAAYFSDQTHHDHVHAGFPG